MPNGEPALLKRRGYLRRDAAEQRWKELLWLGWAPTAPAWGAEVEEWKNADLTPRIAYGRGVSGVISAQRSLEQPLVGKP